MHDERVSGRRSLDIEGTSERVASHGTVLAFFVHTASIYGLGLDSIAWVDVEGGLDIATEQPVEPGGRELVRTGRPVLRHIALGRNCDWLIEQLALTLHLILGCGSGKAAAWLALLILVFIAALKLETAAFGDAVKLDATPNFAGVMSIVRFELQAGVVRLTETDDCENPITLHIGDLCDSCSAANQESDKEAHSSP